MPRGHHLPPVRIREPQVVPMTEREYVQAVSALAAVIASWGAARGHLTTANQRDLPTSPRAGEYPTLA